MTRYYTTSEVAKICNVHRNTIIGSIRKGLLRIHRTPGGHARISQEDLDDFRHRRSLPGTGTVSRNNRILVVDDDLAFAQTLAGGLEELGYAVEVANTAFLAGYLLAKFSPDLLLADLLLADVRGDEICRQIRTTPGERDIAIIGVSATSDKVLVDSMLEAGVDDFVAKPFDLEYLVERIVRLIGPIVVGASGRATTRNLGIRDTSRMTVPVQTKTRGTKTSEKASKDSDSHVASASSSDSFPALK